jgi:hypothetical protein
MTDSKKSLLRIIDFAHDWLLRRTHGVTEEEGNWKPPLETNTVNFDLKHIMCTFHKFYAPIAEKPPSKYMIDEFEYENTIENLLPMLEDQRDMLKALIQNMTQKDLERPRTMLFKKKKIPVEMSIMDILVDYGNHMSDMVGHIAVKRGMFKREKGLPGGTVLLKAPDEYKAAIRKRIKK